ncbi:MAG TPA: sigma factor, partial [Polyangiaceae bacterium]
MASDWSSVTFRNALTAMVRRRVPDRDVEDVVQSTLVEALASATKPNEPEAMRKWIWGIARNKVADYHRRAKRETVGVPEHSPELVTNEGPFDDMLDWAMRELPRDQDAKQTFEMLLREADGDKLETIAENASLPAPRVRQRVSRLRRHFRERWAADLAALAALGIVTVLLVMWWKNRHPDEPIARPDQSVVPPEPTPLDRANEERKNAFAHCDALEWQPCLDGLDRAKALDPAGDQAENVQNARKLAEDALHPAPAPTTTPTIAP